MGQLIQRWTRKSNQRFKNWLGNLGQKVAGKVGGLYKTAVLDPQKEMNLELAQYQFDKNKEMWDLQNEYNSPENQRKRMEEAGFNPNYIAGGGASGTGNASSMPQYNVQAPQVDPMSFYARIVQAAQGLMNIRLQAANVRKAEAQAGKVGVESKFLVDTAGVRKGNLWQYQSSAQAQEALARQLHIFRGGYKEGEKVTDFYQPNGFFARQRTAIDAQIDRAKADTIYRGYQNSLAKYGIFNSSNPFLNLSIKALEAAGIEPLNWLKSNSQGLIDYMRSK